MAMFKVLRGVEANIPSTYTDGCIYFCKDTSNYYIDYIGTDGEPHRSKIAAGYADKLRYMKDGQSIDVNPADIITKDNYLTVIGTATDSKAGLMSGAEHTKLTGIESGANKTIVDDAIKADSTNPVQNKVIAARFAETELAPIHYNAPSDRGRFYLTEGQYNELLARSQAAELPNHDRFCVYGLNREFVGYIQEKIFSDNKGNTYTGFTLVSDDGQFIYIDATASESNNIHYINKYTPMLDAISKPSSVAEGQFIKIKTVNNGTIAETEAVDLVEATYTDSGLMSAPDKAKLDGIALNANKYELPVATTDVLGGVKQGENITIAEDGTISSKNTEYGIVTTTKEGLMSAGDKEKLDGIAANATRVLVDAELSSTSENAIQNKAVKAALDGKSDSDHTHDYIPNSQKGVANGVAALDENGQVPATQLPSYVDDVIEVANYDALPETGETGKIYVTLGDNLTYRWGGTAYVEISKSLAIGTTGSTAAAGNHRHDNATTEADGFMSTAMVEKLNGIESGANAYVLPEASATQLGGIKVGKNLTMTNGVLDATDTIYEDATTSTSGLMSGADKTKLDGIADGATKVIVDTELSNSSINAIQNKAVKAALDNKSDVGHTHDEYVNQNAFGIIKIGAASVEADKAIDTLELASGDNITITPDAENDKIVISAKDTTYVDATQSIHGLMSTADKTKLDGIATGAQVNVIETINSQSLTVGSVDNKSINLEINWVEF